MPYPFIGTDFRNLPSPCYVLEEARLRRNLEILDRVQREGGVRVICALKGFSFWRAFPLVRSYLPGATASSLWEARLAHEEMGGEVHVYAPAYGDDEIDALLDLADHMSFNSPSQWRRFRDRVAAHPRRPSPGLRINPEHSQVSTGLYDPCAPNSRLGTVRGQLDESDLDGIEGLHVHALCEQDSQALASLLTAVRERFGDLLPRMRWLNLGGGHHITREDYDVDHLIFLLRDLRADHPGLEVILEPGEAVGWRTGELVATVLDVVRNGLDIAILDVSASAHMPDCLEMPYRPEVMGAGEPGQKAHDFRLGGGTCLAGDVIGDYSFDRPLVPGDRVVFLDMIHYTMVKTTFFNGVRHPAIATWTPDGRAVVHRTFDYADFRNRLG